MRRSPALPLFVIGFISCWVQYFTDSSRAGFGKGFESVAVAKSIANRGAFADPFEYPTGPSAHLAPVYPSVMALAIKLVGFSALLVLFLTAFNAVLLGLLMELVYKIAGGVTGEIAALLVLSSTSAPPQSEGVLTSVLLAAAVWSIRENKPTWAGLWSGLLFVQSPLFARPICLRISFQHAVSQSRGSGGSLNRFPVAFQKLDRVGCAVLCP